MVWPGPTGERSTMWLTIDVGADAHVEWHPCPTVSVAGSDHRMSTVVRLGPRATCRVVEELGLGRGDEQSGLLDASVRIEHAGTAVVHHRERFGPGVPGWGGTTAVGRARFVRQEFRVGQPARPIRRDRRRHGRGCGAPDRIRRHRDPRRRPRPAERAGTCQWLALTTHPASRLWSDHQSTTRRHNQQAEMRRDARWGSQG